MKHFYFADFTVTKSVGPLGSNEAKNKITPPGEEHVLNIQEIEKQILSDEYIEKASKGSTVREVVVDIPDVDEQAYESPIIKETAHVLGKSEMEAIPVTDEVDDVTYSQSFSEPITKETVKDDSGKPVREPLSAPVKEDVLEPFEEDIHATKPVKKEEKASVEKVDQTKSEEKSIKEKKKRKSLTPEEVEVQSNLIVQGKRLMEAILQLSPNHPIVEELRPHLEEAEIDLHEGRIKHSEDTTIRHVILILEDVYVRLEEEKVFFKLRMMCSHYASPSLGEAYSDRQLTLDFELWVENFCVPTCFHVRILKTFLSVRTPSKEITLTLSISVLQ